MEAATHIARQYEWIPARAPEFEDIKAVIQFTSNRAFPYRDAKLRV